MPGPGKFVRRTTDRLMGPYVSGLAAHLSAVQQAIGDLQRRLETFDARRGEEAAQMQRLQTRLVALEQQAERLASGAADDRARAALDHQMLREVYERADEQRAKLYSLRQTSEYDLAFTEEEPLVSFVVPTYDRAQLLRERSIPSILAQSYENIEVIVAGDGSPPEVEAAVRQFDDPRLRFHNRSVRGPYPEDPERRWFMIGTPPLNDGVALARGRWIAILGDDDTVLEDHTERLVDFAQKQRLELAYGRLNVQFANGESLEVGKFPPELGHFALQFSIYHAGLRFFGFEPSDVFYDEPNDWSLARRMLTAGVRVGMTDEVVAVKHESKVPSRAAWTGANT
jgi:cell division protein FtsB